MIHGRVRPADTIGWAWLLASFGFLFVFLLPRKGVEFADEGWVLSASLAAARGWHLDTVVPQAPMWALNALLMLTGADSYIAMRWLFYTLISSCLAIALVAVEPRRRLSGLKIGLISFAGLTTLSSLVSYNTGPPYLLLAGVALFVLVELPSSPITQVTLAIVSGLALTATGFLNFTLYPAVPVSLALAWMARERPRYAWVSLLTVVIASGSAIAWYLGAIGLQTFFRYPGGHSIDYQRLLVAVRLVLEWLVPGLVIWGVTLLLTRHRTPELRRRSLQTVAAAAVLAVSVFFLLYLLYKLNLSAIGQRLDPVLQAATAFKLANVGALSQGLAPHVIALWGVALFALTVVLCRAADVAYRRVLLYGACLYACYLCQEFFSLMDPRLIPIYYAGPCLAMAFYLLLRGPANVATQVMGGAALVVTLAGAIAYSLNYNHPNLNPVLGRKVDVAVAKLAGLKESPERAETLARLAEAFDEYGCRERRFVTFHATSVLYYLFEVEPPRGIEYLYVPYIFDSAAVLRTLQQSPRWCVFVSWNWLDWPKAVDKPGTDAVMDYLRSRSTSIIRLSPHAKMVHPYDDFVLYLGPGT